MDIHELNARLSFLEGTVEALRFRIKDLEEFVEPNSPYWKRTSI